MNITETTPQEDEAWAEIERRQKEIANREPAGIDAVALQMCRSAGLADDTAATLIWRIAGWMKAKAEPSEAEQAAWVAGIHAGREMERSNTAVSAQAQPTDDEILKLLQGSGALVTLSGVGAIRAALAKWGNAAPVAAQAQPIPSNSTGLEQPVSGADGLLDLVIENLARQYECHTSPGFKGFARAVAHLAQLNAPGQPQPSGNAGELTDEQIEAMAATLGMSDSRPLGQQWDSVCKLVRAALAARASGQDREDPFQPAANWLINGAKVNKFQLAHQLRIGIGRAERLYEIALSAEKEQS